MKKITLALFVAAIAVSSLSSCGHSPYKKHKKCSGNGSWYGNRNLGAIDNTTDKNTYAKDTYVLDKNI